MSDAFEKLHVKLHFSDAEEAMPVGILALDRTPRSRRIYFQYDEAFLAQPLPLSPLNLPAERKVFCFTDSAFEYLPGVFNDSLPDGWGRLLFDRFARRQGIAPQEITPLQRLAHIGGKGMGALIYEPAYDDAEADIPAGALNLDRFSEAADQVLRGASEEVLAELLHLNGSSAGARPKALIYMDEAGKNSIYADDAPADFEPWLVKFGNSRDGADAGAIEYVYALMAREAGLDMPPARLLPAQDGAGYFAVRRFDRAGAQRLHMHSAAGLLQADFRACSLDYKELLSLTRYMTKDAKQAEKLFRLAVFNALAHNQDDHGKNFSFLMDKGGVWKLAPAYDLNFSYGVNGEQSTMILGKGKNFTDADFKELGTHFKIGKNEVCTIIESVRAALSQWRELAVNCGVSSAKVEEVGFYIGIN